MFSLGISLNLIWQKREAERNSKLVELFRSADENGNGKITPEQMIKIFEANDIKIPNIDEEAAKLRDKEGWIKIGDFMKYAVTTDLCKVEYVDRVFHKKEAEAQKNKSVKETVQKKVREDVKMDRVELAFRKFDLDKDGYLSREEFDLMMKNVKKVQADRIFYTCNTSGTNMISLEEFRKMMERGKE